MGILYWPLTHSWPSGPARQAKTSRNTPPPLARERSSGRQAHAGTGLLKVQHLTACYPVGEARFGADPPFACRTASCPVFRPGTRRPSAAAAGCAATSRLREASSPHRPQGSPAGGRRAPGITAVPLGQRRARTLHTATDKPSRPTTSRQINCFTPEGAGCLHDASSAA